jgi:hypothetical protein
MRHVQATWHPERDNMAWGEPAPRLARVPPVETSGPITCGPWPWSRWVRPSCCKFSVECKIFSSSRVTEMSNNSVVNNTDGVVI